MIVFECICVVACRFTFVALLLELVPLSIEMRNVNVKHVTTLVLKR